MKKTFVLVSVLLFSGCALSSETVRPDDLSREGHMEEAGRHRDKALEHRKRYDPRARLETDSLDPDQVRYTPEVYNPTLWHRHEADRQLVLAEQHREAADELAKFEENECRLFPARTRKLCPLLGSMDSVEQIEKGVRIRLKEGVSLEAVVAHARCHIAFGRERGREGMPGCPLYVKGVRAKASADGKYIEITGESSQSVEDIRSRVSDHVGGHSGGD